MPNGNVKFEFKISKKMCLCGLCTQIITLTSTKIKTPIKQMTVELSTFLILKKPCSVIYFELEKQKTIFSFSQVIRYFHYFFKTLFFTNGIKINIIKRSFNFGLILTFAIYLILI